MHARTRRLIVLTHRYSAFVLGAWFVLLGLTGAMLVFRDEIDAWLNPAELRASASGGTQDVLAIHAAARADYPDGHIERIHLPQRPGEVYRVLVRSDARLRVGSARVEAMYDPATARRLGARDPAERALRPLVLMQTIYELHHRVLLGNTGKDAVGIVGIVLAFTTVIGVVLALPNLRLASWRRAFGVKVRASAKRLLYDLHRAVGLALALFMFLAAATGALMAYPEYARDAVGLVSPVRLLPAVPWSTVERRDPDWAAALGLVAAQYPNQRATEIHFPSRVTAPLLVYLRGASDVHRLGDTIILVNPLRNELLVERGPRNRTAGEAFLHWLFPLHSGTAAGEVGRWLAFITGLLPAWLLATGIVVWLNKRRGEQLRRFRSRTLHQH